MNIGLEVRGGSSDLKLRERGPRPPSDATGPVALFTGGSLMVGTVGRTDLLADDAAGHVPDAVNVELGPLPVATVADGPVAAMCGKTERAMTAASVLERRGHHGVAVVRGDIAWTASHRAHAAR